MKKTILALVFPFVAALLHAQTTVVPCQVTILGQTGTQIRINRNDLDNLFALKSTKAGCRVVSYEITLTGPHQCINQSLINSDSLSLSHRFQMKSKGTNAVYFDKVRFSCAECPVQNFVVRLYP